MFAFEDLLEALDSLGKRHVAALQAGKLSSNEERLGQESLDLSRSGYGHPYHGSIEGYAQRRWKISVLYGE